MQVSQYIIDSWMKPLRKDLQYFQVFAIIEAFKQLDANTKPTVKRVINLISAEPNTNSQRHTLSFLKRYIRGLDGEILVKFLRYCTGAAMICVDSTQVTFTDLDDLARSPIAHTCGSGLELPTTYQSFPQFREEINNIFSSQYWDIDIL